MLYFQLQVWRQRLDYFRIAGNKHDELTPPHCRLTEQTTPSNHAPENDASLSRAATFALGGGRNGSPPFNFGKRRRVWG